MKISLNGADWQFKDYYGEDWRWRDPHKPVNRDTRFWRTGSVPGTVYDDLWRLDEIPDPYFERNSLLLEWVPARTWLYKKTFWVDAKLRGQRVQLHFAGVDYAAEFFLNGESLGTHVGMYTPAVFEVGDQLIYGGDNLIAVVIEPAPHEQPQVSRTSRVRTHKSRMTYWWDFCPRMIHVGIWDEVYLNVTGQTRIEDVFVRPQLSTDFQQADLEIALEVDAAQAATVEIETIIRLNGEVIASQRMTQNVVMGRNTFKDTLALEQPQLWYPNGYGEQPLYKAEVKVYATPPLDPLPVHREGNGLLDQRVVRFGIRQIELVHNETSDPTARPYTFVINGRKIYIKGWNWVPIDVMYGVPRPAKLLHLFTLARQAHVNMLRIWGGGLIEKEAFYDLADELGILIWQEFIQSSSGIENNPATDPAFITMMVNEAEQIIPRKRHHPSLTLWCGGNELTGGSEQPLDDSHPLLGALGAVVKRLDPDRHWLPTSPTGRVFSNTLDIIERDPTALHDVHGPWEYQGVTGQQTLYNRSTSLLHSEFGVEGITNLKTLNAVIAPEHQRPVALENPYWFHLGNWWHKPPVWRETFGDLTHDVPALVKATQHMQASALKYAVEADRRRKYQNSGTLPWQFNEPYPMATCTSAVDYYGQAKPSYYAVAHAYEPVHVSAKFPTTAWAGRSLFEAEIWVNNSHEAAIAAATLQARIIGLRGQIYREQVETITLAPNAATLAATLQRSLEDIDEAIFYLQLVLHDQASQRLSENRYLFTRTENLAVLLTAPTTTLDVEITQTPSPNSRGGVLITNTGDVTALFIWLEDTRPIGATGYAHFEQNHFCLLPGEAKMIQIDWQDVPPNERQLKIAGWNTAEYIQVMGGRD